MIIPLPGTLLITKGNLKEAEEIFEELLSRNPENHLYYRKMEEATASDTSEKKLAMYQLYRDKYPKAAAPQRLPLNFSTGK